MAGNKKTTNYVSKEELVVEIIKSKTKIRADPTLTPAQVLTPELVLMLKKLVDRYAQHNRWRNYTYNDDLRSEALLSLCQNALKFDETKYDNPFGYFTQIAKHSFMSYVDKEWRLRDIRDDIVELNEQIPSLTRQMEGETEKFAPVIPVAVKGVKADSAEVVRLKEQLDQFLQIIDRLNKTRTPDLELDSIIGGLMDLEVIRFTGSLADASFLVPGDCAHSVRLDQEIAGMTGVTIVSVSRPGSNFQRVLQAPHPDHQIPIALAGLCLTLHRETLTKRIKKMTTAPEPTVNLFTQTKGNTVIDAYRDTESWSAESSEMPLIKAPRGPKKKTST